MKTTFGIRVGLTAFTALLAITIFAGAYAIQLRTAPPLLPPPVKVAAISCTA